jgi:alpha-tubulin suppressor-like RCC1 family protein
MRGACGIGEFVECFTPKPVKLGPSNEIIQISAGGHHSLILNSTGQVLSFGYGSHG